MAETSIPKKVQELMDIHGLGIPHISSDRDYVVEVYPYPKKRDGRFGNIAHDPFQKYVRVVDVKSGRDWGQWVD